MLSFQVKNSSSTKTPKSHVDFDSLPTTKSSKLTVPTNSKSLSDLQHQQQQQQQQPNNRIANTVTNNYEILEYDYQQNHHPHHSLNSPSQCLQNTINTTHSHSNSNTIQSTNTSNIATIEYDANTIEVYSYRDDNVVYVEEKKQLAPQPPLPLPPPPPLSLQQQHQQSKTPSPPLPPLPSLLPLSITNSNSNSYHTTPSKSENQTATTTFCEVVKAAVSNNYESNTTARRLIPAQTYNFQNVKYLIDINDLKNHLTSNYDNTMGQTKSSTSVTTLDNASNIISCLMEIY